MKKSPEAFRTISEVADWLDTPAHVLRFWESRFAQVKPVKRAGGRRYYRPNDMLLLGGIKKLLHEDGMTIRGVQKLLRDEGVRHVAAFSAPLSIDATGEIIDAEAPEDRMEAGLLLDAEPEPIDNIHRLTPDLRIEPETSPADEQTDADADTGDLFRMDGAEDEPDSEALFSQSLATGGTESDEAATRTEPAAIVTEPPRPANVDVPADPDDEIAIGPDSVPGIIEVARSLRHAQRRSSGYRRAGPDPVAMQSIWDRLVALRQRMAAAD